MPNTKEQSVAVITVKHPDTMTPRERRAIADWMRRQAEFLEQHGHECSARFTARYWSR